LGKRNVAYENLERQLGERNVAFRDVIRQLGDRNEAYGRLERQLGERNVAYEGLEQQLGEKDLAYSEFEQRLGGILTEFQGIEDMRKAMELDEQKRVQKFEQAMEQCEKYEALLCEVKNMGTIVEQLDLVKEDNGQEAVEEASPEFETFLCKSAPHEYTCPISRSFFRDPVLCLADGFSYERSSIESWAAQCIGNGQEFTSPMTGRVGGGKRRD
jgi:hypothetical protein